MIKILVGITTCLAFLSACSVSTLTGVTAIDTGTSVVVTNHLTTVLYQNTLVVTGADDNFKPVEPCKIETKTIWSCNLGAINPGDNIAVAYKGSLLSGNEFSVEQGTGKIYPAIVRK